MNIILYPFMLLSAVGLILSTGIHIMALADMELFEGWLVQPLHFGIFIVMVPASLVSSWMVHVAYGNFNFSKYSRPEYDFWKVALAGCPIWMQRVYYSLVVYGLISFYLWTPYKINIPKSANHASDVFFLPGCGAYLLVFYCSAFAMLFSAIRAPQLLRRKVCPNGHAVGPGGKSCPVCDHVFPIRSDNFDSTSVE